MNSPPLNVYFLIPGDINTRTGGYRYDKRILEGLRLRGVSVKLISLDGDFPFPNKEQREKASATLALLPDQALTLIDGLAYGVLPEQLAEHSHRLRLVALVHHPLALETGNSASDARTLKQLETLALSHAQRVITTSPSTSKSLGDYAVASDIITTICPGTDPAPLAHGACTVDKNLLCVATLTQRKGHRILLEALAQLQDVPWTLHCVGSHERDSITAKALVQQCAELSLSDRVHFLGEVDEATLNTLYLDADLFVLASFHEGYGMVLDEAIARGLPIIASQAGAIPDTLPSDAGCLFPPGDVKALAKALRQFLEEDQTRKALTTAARAARQNLRTWEQATIEFEAALIW